MQFAQYRHFRRVMGSTLAGAVLLGLGGCPVAQVPRTPANDNSNVAGADDGGLSANANTVGGRPVRPIPSVPVDAGTNTGTDSPEDPTIPTSDIPVVAPLSISISNFAAAVNVLPGTDQQLLYEVVGGRVEDGAISVQIYVDRDGIESSGDEVFLLSGLPARGIAVFPTLDLAPGRYNVAVRASNQRSSSIRYATGQLELVGEAVVQITSPASDVRARPSGIVPVDARIDSLAQTLSWIVFTDSDTSFNGNERVEFSGGGASIRGSILLQGLGQGSFYIGVRVTDSLGQVFVQYGGPSDCASLGNCRQVSIDGAPSVEVIEPLSTITTLPGDQDVRVVVRAQDPEANAVVTIFRDVDGQLDGDEFDLQSFQLSSLEGEFEIMVQTADLFPASYHIGARITDGAGPAVSDYASATLNVVSPPAFVGEVIDPLFLFSNNPDRFFGRNAASLSDPVGVNFDVSDPQGVLALQPTGVALEYFLDANTDGEPDSQNPLLTVRSNTFRTGPNRDLLDLSSLGLPADPDGLTDVLARVVLTDRNGIRVEGELTRVARRDATPPFIGISLPNTNQTIKRGAAREPADTTNPDAIIQIRFFPQDNDPVTLLRVLLVPQPVEDGGPPSFIQPIPLVFDTTLGLDNAGTIMPDLNYQLFASQPAAPDTPFPLRQPVAEGKYTLELQVEDSTGTRNFVARQTLGGNPVIITVVP